ncbi:MAG: EAL domain-containing protein, partial [Acidimicrobiales bacterium]
APRARKAVVSHNRVRTLGLAVAVLNVSLVPLVATNDRHSTGLLLAVQAMGALTALLFFFGFSAPRALRARWRRTELLALRIGEAELMAAESEAAVASIVLPQAVRLVAARAAALLDRTGALIATHQIDVREAEPLLPRLSTPTGPATDPVVSAGTVAVPLHQGWLVLFSQEGQGGAGPDELAILESLGHLAGLAIDRAELFQRDRLARIALAEREVELAEAQRTAQLGSYTWDLTTSEINWSEEMRHLLGFDRAADVDADPSFLAHVHPEDRDVVLRAWEAASVATEPVSVEYRIVRPDGAVRWIHGRVRPVLDARGTPRRLVGTVQDVTERRAVESDLAHAALHDSLTGLPNRAAFVKRLDEVMEQRGHRPVGVAVFFLDIDRFKWLNDSRGHAAGDELLVETGRRLRAAMRPGDAVARFGGDEFVVLCEDVATEAEAERLADRLAAVLGEPVDLAGGETAITVSIGIAYLAASEAALTCEALVGDADAAMYQAKEGGRDRHEIFDASTRRSATTRHETVNAMRRGLDRHEFVVHYQPEIDLITGQLVGFEALVRWSRPGHGLLAPQDFIPLAEETGLIVPIGAEVLRTACRQAATWQAAIPDQGNQGPRQLSLSVNLAPRQLLDPSLFDVVEAALVDAGLLPSQLCLEITESVLLSDADASARAMARLRGLGVSIAVDDFGTGFSSLTYLKQFPVDVLKIDRSFVEGLGRSREDRAIVASVVDLAHAFGLTTIAEGVETIEQLAELRTIGCEQGQGYLWSRALPAPEASSWLAHHHPPSAPASGPDDQDAPARRVLIVDDDRTYRQALRLVIEGEPRYRVVAEADDGREAIALARHHEPDLILLDLAMPGMGGLEALPLLLAVAPAATVVVLSSLEPALMMEKAGGQGATAFCTKLDGPTTILDAIRHLGPCAAA